LSDELGKVNVEVQKKVDQILHARPSAYLMEWTI